jgi:phosphoglycolate phosphatase
MNNPYDLVVFDWEGTIADTLGMILHVVAKEANLLGFGDFDLDQVRNYVDLGLIHALRKAFPHLSVPQQQQLVQAVQHAMHTRPLDVCLMPGVEEFIYQLHEAGINVGVATNKGQHSLMRDLQATDLNTIIKVTRSAGQTPAKPCPQMLAEIIEAYGTTTAATLMIGDSPIDMEMAGTIQVTALGVDFYHQQETMLKAAGALAVFDNYKQIAKFLNLS